jgi:N12 class adenine-specific DNA methylase/adenine-specific DNA methylase
MSSILQDWGQVQADPGYQKLSGSEQEYVQRQWLSQRAPTLDALPQSAKDFVITKVRGIANPNLAQPSETISNPLTAFGRSYLDEEANNTLEGTALRAGNRAINGPAADKPFDSAFHTGQDFDTPGEGVFGSPASAAAYAGRFAAQLAAPTNAAGAIAAPFKAAKAAAEIAQLTPEAIAGYHAVGGLPAVAKAIVAPALPAATHGAAAGGAYMGSYDALGQYADTGEIDPAQAAESALMGAGIGSVLGAAIPISHTLPAGFHNTDIGALAKGGVKKFANALDIPYSDGPGNVAPPVPVSPVAPVASGPLVDPGTLAAFQQMRVAGERTNAARQNGTVGDQVSAEAHLRVATQAFQDALANQKAPEPAVPVAAPLPTAPQIHPLIAHAQFLNDEMQNLGSRIKSAGEAGDLEAVMRLSAEVDGLKAQMHATAAEIAKPATNIIPTAAAPAPNLTGDAMAEHFGGRTGADVAATRASNRADTASAMEDAQTRAYNEFVSEIHKSAGSPEVMPAEPPALEDWLAQFHQAPLHTDTPGPLDARSPLRQIASEVPRPAETSTVDAVPPGPRGRVAPRTTDSFNEPQPSPMGDSEPPGAVSSSPHTPPPAPTPAGGSSFKMGPAGEVEYHSPQMYIRGVVRDGELYVHQAQKNPDSKEKGQYAKGLNDVVAKLREQGTYVDRVTGDSSPAAVTAKQRGFGERFRVTGPPDPISGQVPTEVRYPSASQESAAPPSAMQAAVHTAIERIGKAKGTVTHAIATGDGHGVIFFNNSQGKPGHLIVDPEGNMVPITLHSKAVGTVTRDMSGHVLYGEGSAPVAKPVVQGKRKAAAQEEPHLKEPAKAADTTGIRQDIVDMWVKTKDIADGLRGAGIGNLYDKPLAYFARLREIAKGEEDLVHWINKAEDANKDFVRATREGDKPEQNRALAQLQRAEEATRGFAKHSSSELEAHHPDAPARAAAKAARAHANEATSKPEKTAEPRNGEATSNWRADGSPKNRAELAGARAARDKETAAAQATTAKSEPKVAAKADHEKTPDELRAEDAALAKIQEDRAAAKALRATAPAKPKAGAGLVDTAATSEPAPVAQSKSKTAIERAAELHAEADAIGKDLFNRLNAAGPSNEMIQYLVKKGTAYMLEGIHHVAEWTAKMVDHVREMGGQKAVDALEPKLDDVYDEALAQRRKELQALLTDHEAKQATPSDAGGKVEVGPTPQEDAHVEDRTATPGPVRELGPQHAPGSQSQDGEGVGYGPEQLGGGRGEPHQGSDRGTDAVRHPGEPSDGRGNQGSSSRDPLVEKPSGDERAAQGEQPGSTKKPDAPMPAGGNYHIPDNVDPAAGGKKTKLRANLDAVKLLNDLTKEGRQATADEQAVLAKYVGWGGIPEAFNSDHPNDKTFAKAYHELAELLGGVDSDAYKAARASTTNAHFTAKDVISSIYDALGRAGFKGGDVLEPGMGTGNFFGWMPTEMKGKSRLTGVELDPVTGAIAKQLYPKAAIHVDGFENVPMPSNHFDLVVGNVPFSDAYKPFDKTLNPGSKLNLHDYFFRKALDVTRPGGVVAFITSTGTLDKLDPMTRALLAKEADLVAAVRLPGDAFKKNAMTQVTTDMIVLRKRAPGDAAAGPAWLKTKEIQLAGQPFKLNEYYADHPEMVLGNLADDKLHPGRLAVQSDDRPIGQAISDALGNLPHDLFKEPIKASTQDVAPSVLVPPSSVVREGAFTIHDGKLVVRQNGRLLAADFPKGIKDPELRARGMVGLRDVTRDLLNAQSADRPKDEIKALQDKLGRVYDAFVKKHSFLNAQSNARTFADDPDFPLVMALENYDRDNKTATKADIFTKRTIQPTKRIEHADNAQDAMIGSLAEKGAVDLTFMSQITGTPKDLLVKELGDHVFEDPAAGWQTKEAYLTGNVRQKLAFAREAAKSDPRFTRNVEALEKAQPEDVAFPDVEVRMGAPWVPSDVIKQFLSEKLGLEAAHFKTEYSKANASWHLEGSQTAERSQANTNEWAGGGKGMLALVKDLMNLKDTRVMKERGGDLPPELDAEATEAARQAKERIKAEFRRWLGEDPARADRMARIYNDTYNNTVLRTYDGSHLHLPGQNPSITLNPHQKSAIWRVIQERRGLLAHAVGAGKTYTMVGASMELRRLGLAKKPMHVIPNHMIDQYPGEFMQLYPGAKLLTVRQKDLAKDNRQKLFARIATGDWDAVVVSHSQLKRLPVSKKVQMQIHEEAIASIQQSIAEANAQAATEGRKSKSSNAMVKELEKAKERIESKMKKLNDITKDEAVTFEHLGVDHLFVDEAHNFKNLFYSTKMNRVKGLGDTEGSKRAFDLYAKVRHIQDTNGGRGVTFSTGTPLTNSMAELYTLQRYLTPEILKEGGLQHFDAWASSFGDTTTSLELAMDGKSFKPVTRFARFFNLPELLSSFRTVADIQTSEMLGLPTPELKTGKVIPVLAKPSPELLAYTADLVRRAKAIKGPAQKGSDNHLTLTGLGRTAALSMRLISDHYADDPGNKVNMLVRNVLDEHKAGTNVDVLNPASKEHEKGNLTQLVFLDTRAPKGEFKAEPVEGTDHEEEPETNHNADFDVQDFSDGKSAYSPYHDIKQKLINGGIPEKEIAFIHDAKTDVQRMKLIADVREGRVRVLLGSTPKMGEGTNFQKYLVAVHHLDATWTPAGMEQRNGRIIRQGNWNRGVRPVKVYAYSTERSFDSNMFQLLDAKQKFINQIMRGDPTMRMAEDLDSASVLDPGMMAALASGNPLVKERAENEVHINRLTSAQKDIQRRVAKARQEANTIPGEISAAHDNIAFAQQDLDTYRKNKTDKFEATIDGKTYTDRAEAFTSAQEAGKGLPLDKANRIGTYAGLPITSFRTYDHAGNISNEIRLAEIWSMHQVEPSIKSFIGRQQEIVQGRERDLKSAQKTMATTFDQQHELDELTARQKAIVKQMDDEQKASDATPDAGPSAEDARLLAGIERRAAPPVAPATDATEFGNGVTAHPMGTYKAKPLHPEAIPDGTSVPGWMTGTIGGKPAYTQGHYALVGEPPAAYRGKALSSRPLGEGQSMDRLIDPHLGGAPIAPVGHIAQGHDRHVVMSDGSVIKAPIYDQVKRGHPDSTFTHKGPEDPVIIHSDGAHVGVAMPQKQFGPVREAADYLVKTKTPTDNGGGSPLDTHGDVAEQIHALANTADGQESFALHNIKRLFAEEDGFLKPQALLEHLFPNPNKARAPKPVANQGEALKFTSEAHVGKQLPGIQKKVDRLVEARAHAFAIGDNKMVARFDKAIAKFRGELEGQYQSARHTRGRATDVAPLIAPELHQPGPQPDGVTVPTGPGPTSSGDKYAGNLNMWRINSPDDIKATLETMTHAAKDQIQAARGPAETHAALEQLANASSYSMDDILAHHDGPMGRVQMLVARNYLTSSGAHLVDLAGRIKAGDNSDAMRLNFIRATELHMQADAIIAGAKTEWGRTGHALQIQSRVQANQVKELKRIVDGMGGDKIDLLANAIAQLDSIGDISAAARKAMQPTLWSKSAEYFINSILSGPPTHIRNFVGNAMNIAGMLAEDTVAAGIGAARGTKDGVTMREVNAELAGLIAALPDAWKAFLAVRKTGVAVSGIGQIDLHQGQIGKGYIPGIDFGHVVRTPGRYLTASDEGFKLIIHRMSTYGQSVRTAIAESGGQHSESEIADRIAHLIEHPTDEMHDQAVSDAHYHTFQQELGEFGKRFNSMKSAFPPLNFVIPFYKTPTNIVKYAGERSPLALLSANVRAEFAAGGARADKAGAKMATGTALMVWAMGLAAGGMLTGGGPTDPGKKAGLLATGWRPYSVVILNPLTGKHNYLPFNNLGQVGMLAGVAADLAAPDSPTLPNNEKYGMVGTALSTMFQNFAAQTFWKGISDLANVTSDPNRYLGNYVNSMTSALVPQIVAKTAQAIDPRMHDVKDEGLVAGLVKNLAQRVPGASYLVPEKHTSTGKPQERGNGGLGDPITRAAETMFSPFSRGVETDDKAVAEMGRLGIGGGNAPGKVHAYGRDIQLTQEQHQAFNLLHSQEVGKLLEPFVNRAGYDHLTDLQKEKSLKMLHERASTAATRMFIGQHRELAQQGRK